MIVLDTHALIWWVDGDARLSDNARHAIQTELDREGQIQISVFNLSPETLLPN